MKNLAELIANALRNPKGLDLHERCLESMVLMERYRGRSTVTEIVPNTIDADITPATITHLAEALARFIKDHPDHPNVGSAIFALGTLAEPRFAELFERVLTPGSGYNDFARDQAIVSLENLGYGPETP